ncbi:MAG: zinc ABC transporter solute-binding protein [Firmicutes bacterium]|nr:zinc ABC transporter solute-binding protein [Bacillota bacterium]
MNQKGRKRRWFLLLPVLLAIILVVVGLGWKNATLRKLARTGPLIVFVSILPQKYFVERVGGRRGKVAVLGGPGQNPVSFEPLPKQMAALAEADLFFRIGVPFETALIDRIQELNPGLNMVDTREGIPLRPIEGAHQHEAPERRRNAQEPESVERNEMMDPHIWLDPLLVKIQAETICRALVALDPINQAFYEENLRLFQAELDQLDRELAATFRAAQVEKIMVYHPAWGYLTDRYDLEQIPIEVEGKEPGPQQLAQVIERAKQEGIRVIFVQSQFDTRTAESVARAVDGKVLTLDPLAEDYLTNLRQIAQTIARGF